ncbi:hypothetical protein DF268_31160 [Streptomyces sp. V2]|uniref:hypothetical protein n=1 Tax=Streptomyces niveiscabiei TaxID=164115 RepID=UPI000D670F89|nr:hypothetical protein DF268_31160 [Streptomyces sp. V2]
MLPAASPAASTVVISSRRSRPVSVAAQVVSSSTSLATYPRRVAHKAPCHPFLAVPTAEGQGRESATRTEDCQFGYGFKVQVRPCRALRRVPQVCSGRQEAQG